jgi:CBS domain containing-hemolysin-like protein
MIILLILLLLVLLMMICFASVSETSLFSLSSMKVKVFKQDSDPRKQLVAALLAHPRDLLITLTMLNIAISILLQNVASSLFGDFSGWLLNVGVPLSLTLIFGEVIPKSLALANNEKIAYRVAPFLHFAEKVLLPFGRILTRITHLVSRCMFFFLKKEEEISIDELQHTLRTSKQYGVLNEDEAELVRGYLNLQERTVKDLMRPREEVIIYSTEEPLSRLIHLFVDQEVSRIPVCEESLDSILGIMTSRLYFLYRDKIKTHLDLLPILKKPFYIPESSPAESLLEKLYERQESIAIVVDEYGSISGIITLEDLVEVVVGEIVDRRDEKSRYTRSGEDVIIASGKLELAEFEEIFEIPLESVNHMVTIGGWLTEQMGDIPKSGAKFMTKDFLFHVLASDKTRVRRVYVRRLKRR